MYNKTMVDCACDEHNCTKHSICPTDPECSCDKNKLVMRAQLVQHRSILGASLASPPINTLRVIIETSSSSLFHQATAFFESSQPKIKSTYSSTELFSTPSSPKKNISQIP